MFSGQLLGGEKQPANWHIADEVPLVIFYNSVQFGVMMLTPTDFKDFAIGFSLTEGIVSSHLEISDIRLETIGDGMAVNIIVPEAALKVAQNRKRTISGGSSCGICGAQTLETALPRPPQTCGFIPNPETALFALTGLPAAQKLNQLSRSTQAAAFADKEGNIILIREDVGRHNSLDKLCGAMALNNQTPLGGFLVLSSRFSVELAQKAASIGFSFVVCVSAPTALALKTAKLAKMSVATQSNTQIMWFD